MPDLQRFSGPDGLAVKSCDTKHERVGQPTAANRDFAIPAVYVGPLPLTIDRSEHNRRSDAQQSLTTLE
jgi:hypothetical protein